MSLFEALKFFSNQNRLEWISYDNNELRVQLLEMTTQQKCRISTISHLYSLQM